MQLLRRYAQQKNIELRAEFVQINEEEEEGENLQNPMIETDQSRVMQVLLCLFSNAVKFTQNGSVKIIVEIIKREHDTYLEIQVVDTGVGIAKKD